MGTLIERLRVKRKRASQHASNKSVDAEYAGCWGGMRVAMHSDG